MSPKPVRGPLKYLLIGLGCLAVAAATIGVFMPLIPTVPFLLLATFCFSRSSARMQVWLYNNRLLGPYLRNYLERKGLTKRQLISSLISMWVGMSIAILIAPVVAVKWGLVAIGVAVSIHLIRMKRLLPGEVE
ncbi:YbaN family protein [Ferrimonas balearica]|uniref:YbaN family protein n=1 Tax=Ferrimonas balearica TaxID=44012 RepID=UPI001F17F395|nr:YbaN family protein [Ferrimonas balearica]MBY6019000.1 YbaN family protein [Halomonas denitrificans]MBY6095602.1 YbaN family protein [Ferrimonas balearica]